MGFVHSGEVLQPSYKDDLWLAAYIVEDPRGEPERVAFGKAAETSYTLGDGGDDGREALEGERVCCDDGGHVHVAAPGSPDDRLVCRVAKDHKRARDAERALEPR